jgi:hypothetical protein
MARFMRKGITKFYWVITIANGATTKIPTAAEVNAGTRMDTQLAEVAGFSFESNPIQAPDMSTTFTSSVAGEDAVADCSLTFYEDKSSNPISTALAKDTAGFVVIFPRGTAGASPAAADKCDVWPCTVASNAKQYTAGNEAAKYLVKFTPTAPPGTELAVAA